MIDYDLAWKMVEDMPTEWASPHKLFRIADAFREWDPDKARQIDRKRMGMEYLLRTGTARGAEETR